MAKDKKPSIYTDRGTIGSSDELDKYGVWVKSGPQDLSLIGSGDQDSSGEIAEDVSYDIPDIEDLPDFDTLKVNSSEEPFGLDSSEDEITMPDFGSDDDTSGEAEDDSDSDVFNFGDFAEPSGFDTSDLSETTELEDASILTDSTEPEDPDMPAEIDATIDDFETADMDVPDLTPENLNEDDTLDEGDFTEISMDSFLEETEVDKTSGPDLSTQLLLRIAEELTSIRTELSSLKKEFSGLRIATPPPIEEEEGYFGEEDDEKISLTGDELNNILNTADFTEEAGADATVEIIDEVDIQVSEPELSDSIDMEIELDSSDLSDLEEVSADLDLSKEASSDFVVEETEELSEILESGAEPITSDLDKEDADYLVNDPLSEDVAEEGILDLAETIDSSNNIEVDVLELEDLSANIDDESIDLSEAIIDEPDLSSEIQDNPLEEPSLEEISINLDISELGSEELDLEAEELIPEELGVEEPASPEEQFEELSLAGDSEEEPEELLGDDSIPQNEESGLQLISEQELTTSDTEQKSEIYDEEPKAAEAKTKPAAPESSGGFEIPVQLKQELKTILTYMDQLLGALPDEKIDEFARSKYYDTYTKLFKELGIA